MPPVLATWLSGFRNCFTAPVWKHVLVLVAGALLSPGKRTVSEALRVMGLAARPGFARYHEVLSRARWDARAVARRLLAQVLDVFLPAGEVVIGIDDMICIGLDLIGQVSDLGVRLRVSDRSAQQATATGWLC